MGVGETRVVAGRYRLLRALGRGGMGTVWRAHDTLLSRDVAVKEINLPSNGTDAVDPVVRRALREARAAARLHHPGIVTVHDVVIDAGRPWIVMELVDGRSLAETISAEPPLPEWRVAQIGLQVLDALRSAHRQGILHRDVKPANVLLDADRVVLTDFGIAAIEDATALTVTGQMLGSPAYLPPERINGSPATAAGDLWSLGVTLYAALSGSSPFRREDVRATLAAVLASQPDPPARAGRLWPVIEGLLVKDPDHRLTADAAALLLAAVEHSTLDATAPAAGATAGPTVPQGPTVPRPQTSPPTVPWGPTVAQNSAGTAAWAPVPPVAPASVPPVDARYPPTMPWMEPGAPPQPNRTPWVVALAVVAAALVAAVPVTWALLAGGGGSTGSDGSAGGAVSPSVNPNLDACLVGTWRITSLQVTDSALDSSDRLTSPGGAIIRIWPEGREVDDYQDMAPATGDIEGQTTTVVIAGTVTEQVETHRGYEYVSDVTGRLTYTAKSGGVTEASGDLPAPNEAQPYTCDASTLHVYDGSGSSTEVLTRISRDPGAR